MIAKGVTADHDRLGPVRYQTGHVFADDRFTENDAAQNIADGAVWRLPHFFQVEFLHARFIGRDRSTFDADPVLFDRVRRIDCDLVIGGVAMLDR